MLRVDPEKVEAEIAAMVASLADHCEGTTPDDVLHRMQMQVIPAFIRWKLGEMNRSVDENSVLNAVVAFVASQMVSTVVEVIGDPEIEEAHFTLTNKLLRAIGEEVGAIMTGRRQMVQHHVAADPVN